MATVWIRCSGPRSVPRGGLPKICPECGTEIPKIGKAKYVRHLVKLNGRGTPIAGSSIVQPEIPKRPHEDVKPKKKAGPVKKRKRKWSQ